MLGEAETFVERFGWRLARADAERGGEVGAGRLRGGHVCKRGGTCRVGRACHLGRLMQLWAFHDGAAGSSEGSRVRTRSKAAVKRSWAAATRCRVKRQELAGVLGSHRAESRWWRG